MQIGPDDHKLSPLAEQGRAINESRRKAILEPEHTGEAVAIHIDTEDYALGKSHSEAVYALLARHLPDGRIVTHTIGPPTDQDLRLATRITDNQRR